MTRLLFVIILGLTGLGQAAWAGCNPCICGQGGGKPPPPECSDSLEESSTAMATVCGEISDQPTYQIRGRGAILNLYPANQRVFARIRNSVGQLACVSGYKELTGSDRFLVHAIDAGRNE